MNIKQKIKCTGLFSQTEKIELLAGIDELSPESILGLERTIDDYDQSIEELKNDFANQIGAQLDQLSLQTDNIDSQTAITKLKEGFGKILSNT